ncbi:MAG: DUF1836 domain-containing protein [Oscillospiraceae bacterium]|nr:DUF1836 domain-containing protein [Oscillospiraceae bacterium]
MQWNIPGTVLYARRETDGDGEQMLRSMFLGGDITLAQVAGITGLEPYTVQNWVKRGFLTPPMHKRYTIDQLCRIININMLRGVFSLERTCGLLGYINGQLNDRSDDIIGDAQLYFMFISLASRAQQLTRPEACERILSEMLRDYSEPYPGAKERVSNALKVMLTAYLAARMRSSADGMLAELEQEGKKSLENAEI